MHPLIRAATLALTLQQAATASAELAAQASGGHGKPTGSACALVTEKEVEAATSMDYPPGDEIEQEYVPIEGGATCMWGGPGGGLSATGVVVRQDLPEINVTFIAAGARGSHTEQRRKLRLAPKCTRESVRGVGEDAFAEICDGALYGVSVYARTGRNDVLVSAYAMKGLAKAAVKPTAITLAKAAAARAKSR
jgi:hypothetical protein